MGRYQLISAKPPPTTTTEEECEEGGRGRERAAPLMTQLFSHAKWSNRARGGLVIKVDGSPPSPSFSLSLSLCPLSLRMQKKGEESRQMGHFISFLGSPRFSNGLTRLGLGYPMCFQYATEYEKNLEKRAKWGAMSTLQLEISGTPCRSVRVQPCSSRKLQSRIQRGVVWVLQLAPNRKPEEATWRISR